MTTKPFVLGIVGPTASGKTALSLLASQRARVEIVCMDSMQVYRGMDIGTAKPSQSEQALIPHHMLDVVSPLEPYSVARYREDADAAIAGILSRGHLPVLVGGTGLYLRALSLALGFGGTPADAGVRAKWQAYLDSHGAVSLHRTLCEHDAASASRLHPNDTRRVIRALEVHEVTGIPFSQQRMPGYSEGPYDMCLAAPDIERAALYARIEARVDAMMAQGLVEEVRGMVQRGAVADSQAMQGLGYKEMLPYLQGKISLPDTVALIKQRTRNYAKRQLTWFRADSRVRWLSQEEIPHALWRMMEDR